MQVTDLDPQSTSTRTLTILDEAYTLGVNQSPIHIHVPENFLAQIVKARAYNNHKRRTRYKSKINPRLVTLVTHLEQDSGFDEYQSVNAVYESYRQGFIDALSDSVEDEHYKDSYEFIDPVNS